MDNPADAKIYNLEVVVFTNGLVYDPNGLKIGEIGQLGNFLTEVV